MATVATHPYGALVFASQAVFVLARARTKEALVAMGAVAVAGVPFWLTDRVLAGRLEGPLKSAFPDGAPARPDSQETTDAQEPIDAALSDATARKRCRIDGSANAAGPRVRTITSPAENGACSTGA